MLHFSKWLLLPFENSLINNLNNLTLTLTQSDDAGSNSKKTSQLSIMQPDNGQIGTNATISAPKIASRNITTSDDIDDDEPTPAGTLKRKG